MRVVLLTTYLAGYRVPLYERLHQRYGIEVLCYGGGERYVPAWFKDLDAQLAAAPFPARWLQGGAREAFAVSRRYDAVIAPFAGGAVLPAAYFGARRFVLWASVWAQPRGFRHAVALPVTQRIYRRADAVVAYGEHVRRFVAGVRGRDDDVFVAPQSVEPELFARTVDPDSLRAFRAQHRLGDGPLAVYVGRLVAEKGVALLLDAWRDVDATLVVIGDGPLESQARIARNVRFLGPLAREQLPVAYAASLFALLPSIPTPLWREPWGLVCNEAMHQRRPIIASDAVGAVAGGLVRDEVNALVVPAGDREALARAATRLLGDRSLRARLGTEALQSVAPYTYDAMADAFGRALAVAIKPSPTGP
ncbi:MAG TPA: glycosyltransferase family 4 protein [Solirubrobacteraceae bacterium]|nr:glycosyltransferase family 4 protein [Solirubrobacteraceae bacterium]